MAYVYTYLTKSNTNYGKIFVMQIPTMKLALLKLNVIMQKNIVVGVVYRAHTAIDNFIADIDPIFKKLNVGKSRFISWEIFILTSIF